MANLKRKILNIIYLILLLIGITLILWRIFGNSPTDIQVISPFIALGILKLWDISHDLKDIKHSVKISFGKVGNDINSLKNRVEVMENKVGGSKK